jgi:hypothetical protein
MTNETMIAPVDRRINTCPVEITETGANDDYVFNVTVLQ